MLYLKSSIFILFGALVAACAPREYVATGSVGAKKYLLEVTLEDDGLLLRESLAINGEIIYKRAGTVFSDPNCLNTGGADWFCKYDTSYQGAPVRVERGSRVTLTGGGMWYDVFINDELIQRVPVFI